MEECIFFVISNRPKLMLKEIRKCQFLKSVCPTAGQFKVDARLQRHSLTFAVNFLNVAALFQIYYTSLSQHLENESERFFYHHERIGKGLVLMGLHLHNRCAALFYPPLPNSITYSIYVICPIFIKVCCFRTKIHVLHTRIWHACVYMERSVSEAISRLTIRI